MTPSEEVMHKIMAAQELLANARSVALSANPLASQVPAIQRLEQVGKELNELMRQVSRMQL